MSRVDPIKLRTLRTLSVAAPPTDIAAAGGRVWVVTSGPTARFVSVSRIDPQFDAIGPAIRIGNVVPAAPQRWMRVEPASGLPRTPDRSLVWIRKLGAWSGT